MSPRNPLIAFLIQAAEPRLPHPAEYSEEEIYVQVVLTMEEIQQFHLNDPEMAISMPYFNVLFRKQYDNGEAIGWRFVEAD
ncbi:hypothetical protein HUW48_22445 [Adhaeribacter radiodurans]|uniref:Uncharacterized protein n=1 Tax=Adhaeribacter radiodurans TaxID=2745197 RepID=A0A7L7LCV9_9BACT|nr:hypothetical protein HUW48_22445 [Adhaeribacter radiodurans]